MRQFNYHSYLGVTVAAALLVGCAADVDADSNLDVGSVSQELSTAISYATAVPPGGVGSAAVSCPEGSFVTGGGFVGNDNLLTYNVRSYGNGWRTIAKNLSNEEQILASQAICLSEVSGYTTTTSKKVSVAAGATGCAIAKCTSGVPAGGGFVGQSTGWVVVYASVPVSNGWAVCGRNTSQVARPLYSYTECLHGSGASTSIVYGSPKSLPSGKLDYATVACPSGTESLGGGFRVPSKNFHLHKSQGTGGLWTVGARNNSSSTQSMYASIRCLSP